MRLEGGLSPALLQEVRGSMVGFAAGRSENGAPVQHPNGIIPGTVPGTVPVLGTVGLGGTVFYGK